MWLIQLRIAAMGLTLLVAMLPSAATSVEMLPNPIGDFVGDDPFGEPFGFQLELIDVVQGLPEGATVGLAIPAPPNPADTSLVFELSVPGPNDPDVPEDGRIRLFGLVVAAPLSSFGFIGASMSCIIENIEIERLACLFIPWTGTRTFFISTSSLPENALLEAFAISSSRVNVSADAVVLPEPTKDLLLAAGLGCLALLRSRPSSQVRRLASRCA